MPFVEGESLRDRLEREKHLPIADAVRIASEVAAALDYAHRHGVIHRDIKPENILLHDGAALVADFGIALAASKGGGGRMTETGMSLGTPHYMSPEQAMGEREITARSDVYALGAMTYEMLVGDPPFTGSTAQAIVAKVMTERPRPIYPQRDTVPPAVEHAVLTALEKLPADRFATAAQFAEALHATGDTGRTRISTGARARGAAGTSGGWRDRLRDPVVLGLAGIAAACAIAAAWAWRRPPAASTPADVIRFTIPAPPSGSTNALGYNIMAVSPDDRTLVYVSQGDDRRQRLMIRRLDEVAGRPLPGTEDAAYPIFSPDGRWVAFIRGNQVYKVSVDGGSPQTLGMAPGTFNGASWSKTGVIVVSGNTALYVIPETGGAARLLGDRATGDRRALPRRPARGGRRRRGALLELEHQLADQRQDRHRLAGDRRSDRARPPGNPAAGPGERNPALRHGRGHHHGRAGRRGRAAPPRAAGPAGGQRGGQQQHRAGASHRLAPARSSIRAAPRSPRSWWRGLAERSASF